MSAETSCPKIACLCPTYLRPNLLPHAIESFLRQDYPADKRELVILDDAGQYKSQGWNVGGTVWRLVSVPCRFWTLGEKRNATAALASPDVEAYAAWDDDDIYLPWTLKAHAAALERSEWSMPSVVLDDCGNTMKAIPTQGIFHAAWAFSRGLFSRVRGYPFMQSGQDQALGTLFREFSVKPCDPLSLGFEPYFVHRWRTSGSYHLSALPRKDGYERLAEQYRSAPLIETITPCWPKDYTTVPVV